MPETDAASDQVPRKPELILSVQALRGLAVLCVAFLHTHVILAQPDYGGLKIFETLALKGWTGVGLFFVISGFIIVHAHAKDIGQPHRIAAYLWRRFTRIYPLYWILSSGFIAAALVGLGHADFKLEPLHLLSAYSLLSLTDMPSIPLKVAWSLLFEVKFYLFFMLFLISRRAGLIAVALWAAAIVTRNLFTPLPDWGYIAPDWGMLHSWNLYFLLGMASWWASRRFSAQYGIAFLTAGAMLCAGLLSFSAHEMSADTRNPPLMAALALSFSLIVTGVVLCEKRFAFRPPALVLKLGDASYSIYLVHSAAISFLAQANAKLTARLHLTGLPPHLLFAAIFLAAITAGLVCHAVLEQPLTAMIRKIGRMWQAKKPLAPLPIPIAAVLDGNSARQPI
ncbi:acyltransferase family protein [Novosphingobium rosa]|uniref:acyltransferase family protein n=1 Tax=Novosphingobium rosa TaxID=76978 RepID=UPI000831EA6A|nr:acyltransferase [Novosphingobium rosa]